MLNPILNKIKNQPTLKDIKNKLMAQNDNFFIRMQEIARERGISEDDIQKGMDYINTLRR